MKDLPDFERGQVVGARLARASVTKNCYIISFIESGSF
jgi:hypothetical protein